ncbi:MAG: hypothetical protein NWE80_01525, partial [Candidatus Bathyarchaeota archaeon]|nr:hypothetical protein [Candidatus Bathyarchaeota archaeon]
MSYKVFGRRARYVNADLLATEQTVVSDVFRNVIGKFFIVNDKNQIVYDEDEEEIEEFYSLVQKDEETQEEYLYLRATDPNSEELDTFNQDLASLIQTDQSFEDLHYIKNLPISKTILEGMNVVGAVSNIDIEPTYNFYVKPYENYINKTYDYLPENVLPNFYTLYAQSVYGQESFEPLNTLEDNFKK